MHRTHRKGLLQKTSLLLGGLTGFGLATALYKAGERCGTRTHDDLIKSEVLYH